MSIVNRKEPIILLLGDIIFLVISLWLMLAVRYFEIPSMMTWDNHFVPFSILFVFWIIVFYISGLYERHTLLFRTSLPEVLFNTQIFNSIIAVLFFYFIPYFTITPKTNLFLYLVISLLVVIFWRTKVFPLLAPKKKQNAVLIGSGDELLELQHEVNNNNFYGFGFIEVIDINNLQQPNLEEHLLQLIDAQGISLIVADIHNDEVSKVLPRMYNLIFSDVQFVDKYKVYEAIFDRLPSSLMNYGWFLERVSLRSKLTYDFLKRAFDFLFSLVFGVISLVLYPFVYIAVKIDDGGTLFYFDERVGQNNRKFRLMKFRSMTEKDGGEGSISKVGNFLRKTRIDELPQLWNVLRGDLSLIGPRPERTDLTEVYNEQLPFYNVRQVVKPGLSGWAQLKQENHPHHGADVLATLEKLSYDLYYIKNRSVLLDIKVVLQTFKILVSQKGK